MWIPLALLYAATMGMVNVLDKYVLTRVGRGSTIPLLILVPLGALPVPVIAAVHGLPAPTGPVVLLSLAAGGAFVASTLFYFAAANREEISRVVPLFYLSPLFVSILAAVFLDEVFGPRKYAGIVLLVAGALWIGRRPAAPGRPSSRAGRAIALMTLASVFLAVFIVVTKRFVARTDLWSAFALSRVGMLVALLPAYVIHGRELAATVRGLRPRVFGAMAVSEALALTALLLGTAAVGAGPATLVSALSALQPFFVLVLALAATRLRPDLLGEETSRAIVRHKFAAVLVLFAGAFLVTL